LKDGIVSLNGGVLRQRKNIPSHPLAFEEYLPNCISGVPQIFISVSTCTVLYSLHLISMQVPIHQFIWPPVTNVQEGLLLGVGDGMEEGELGTELHALSLQDLASHYFQTGF
jgi:hypothetical protein